MILLIFIKKMKNHKKIFLNLVLLSFVIILHLNWLKTKNFYETNKINSLNQQISNAYTSISNESNEKSIEREESLIQMEAFFAEASKSFVNWKMCDPVPKNLKGNFSLIKAPSNFTAFQYSYKPSLMILSELSFMNDLKLGGSWEPRECIARHRVAIVIPYKNRLDNLNNFLVNMHPLFQRQEIKYTIFVAEQVNDQFFNKGILMNAAFLEILSHSNGNFDCVVFHDVDLLPTGKNNNQK